MAAMSIVGRSGTARMDASTWAVTAAVILLSAAALITALVVRGSQRAPDQSTPAGVVSTYILAIQNSNPDAAWELLAPEAVKDTWLSGQGVLTQGEFHRQALQSHQGTRTGPSSRVRIVNSTQSGRTASVDVEVTSAPGLFDSPSSQRVLFSLKQQDSTWKITSVPESWLF